MRLAVAFGALLVSGCAAMADILPAETKLESTDPAVLATKVRYTDDPLNTAITADTYDVGGKWYVYGRGFQDIYVAAGKSRETGDIAVALHLRSEADEWLFPSQVNFGSPLRTEPMRRGKSDVTCSSSSCLHYEATYAVLTDEDIRAILAAQGPVPVRFKTSQGNLDTTLWSAELEALLTRLGVVDRYR